MAIVISGTTNDITINGVSVATDAEVSSVVAPLATTAYVDGKMVLSTAVTASGTAIDFTNIPSWVKRITVMFNGVSTNGTSQILMQLGDSGGIENVGYLSTVVLSVSNSSPAGNSSTSGIITEYNNVPSNIRNASIELLNIQSNTWLCSGSTAYSNVLATTQFGGTKALSATLDRIRITTVNGTDVFDAGSINIMYEG